MSGRGRAGPESTSRTAPLWVREARPPVPPEFASWIIPWIRAAGEGEADGADDGEDDVGRPSSDTLEAGAEKALRRALQAGDDSGGRERAFHLLAADALLTWACEAALEEDDPAAALERIARRVSVGDDGAGAPRQVGG